MAVIKNDPSMFRSEDVIEELELGGEDYLVECLHCGNEEIVYGVEPNLCPNCDEYLSPDEKTKLV